jgi:hypothetical protein
MTVSTAQGQEVVDQLRAGLSDLSVHLDRIGPATQAAASQPLMPPWLRDAVRTAGEKLKELGSWLLEKITELLKGAGAPITFLVKAYEWQSIRSAASAVAGDLKPEALQVGRLWHGAAAAAYTRQIPPQGNAAARVSSIADKAASSLGICGAAGLTFYVALAVIVYQYINTMIVAIAALGSVVFSLEGLALVIAETEVTSGMLIAAVAALVALLAVQAQQLAALHGEAADAGAFPGGQWPNACASQFSDATVTDGDADWSLRS